MAQRAKAEPLSKVKSMIEQLITRLKEQGNEETTKKAWCDSELGTNKATREEKSDAVSSLQAEMDKVQAEISKLVEELTGLSSELTDLKGAVAQATDLRSKEKAKNEATVSEAKAGQEAVAKAVMVLKDFYAKAARVLRTQRRASATQGEVIKLAVDGKQRILSNEYTILTLSFLTPNDTVFIRASRDDPECDLNNVPTVARRGRNRTGDTAGASLLQRGGSTKLHAAPEVFGDEGYAGMTGAKGGVVSMLEVIEADFSRMEAETTAGEAAAVKEYDSFMEESKITEAEKSKEVEHKTSAKQEKSSELINLQADLQGTEKELAAAETYYEKLKPDCLEAGPSYAERKARREQET
ncbi:unnamed protein product [Effrenium voratum]|nr:unnamed protein product [Effrenium voratum]